MDDAAQNDPQSAWRAEAAALLATAPPLVGSVRQVSWAIELRLRAVTRAVQVVALATEHVDRLRALPPQPPHERLNEAVARVERDRAVLDALLRTRDARPWIDAREGIGETLAAPDATRVHRLQRWGFELPV